MSPGGPPGVPGDGHHHRSWLHLLPQDPAAVPVPAALDRARSVLIESGVALVSPDGFGLRPGPAFAALLGQAEATGPTGRVRPLPLAGARGGPRPGRARGEVRVEAGVLRAYPDPGPLGFHTPQPVAYRAPCPGCEVALEFFTLRFPTGDPMEGGCPRCGAVTAVDRLPWEPPVPFARAEITFGDLDGRPSIAGTPLMDRLVAAWSTDLREVHVTL